MKWQKSATTFVTLVVSLALTYILMFNLAHARTAVEAEVVAAASASLPVIDDFENGGAGITVFSDALDGAAGAQTTVATSTISTDSPVIPAVATTNALSFTYDLVINDWGYAYGGFQHEFATTQDWSQYDGFSFWFYGENSGNIIQVELWDNGPNPAGAERFDTNFVDDFSGWKLFRLPFTGFARATDYQPGGAPDDGLTLTEMWGYNFGIVTTPSSGTFLIDDVMVYATPLVIDDFEDGGAEIGLFSDAFDGAAGATTTVATSTISTDSPVIPVVATTNALSFTYDLVINDWGYAYGGFQHEFATTQDWSQYDGFSFWFYGENSGNIIQVELWDNGPNPAGAERFDTNFVDDFSGWKLFRLPFAGFARATDYQPGGAPDDGLTLTEMWGYNFGIVTTPSSGTFLIDDVTLYRESAEVMRIVQFAQSEFAVVEGAQAVLTVTLSEAYTDTVTVAYASADGTAGSGDYVAVDDILGFDPGETTATITVDTLDNNELDGDKAFTVTLSDPTNSALGGRSSTTVTILDEETPNPNKMVVIDDFENGLPAGTDDNGLAVGFVTWGDTWNGTTVAITTTGTGQAGIDPVPGKQGSNHVIDLTANVVGWGGFTHAFENETADEWISQDWSAYEGVGFWYYGTGSGTTVFVDISENRNPGSTSDDAERWSYEWSDDTAGWQFIQIAFADLNRKDIGNGAPNDGWSGEEVYGWSLGTTGTGGSSETRYVDDFGLLERVTVIDDFESGLPTGFDSDGLQVGFVTWGDFWNGTTVAITTTGTGQAGIDPVPGKQGSNHVIDLTANVVGWGGFTHAFTNETADEWVSQDWSSYNGICFWYYGTGSGTIVFVDISENRNPGSTTDDAERWSYEWSDDTAGWQFVQIPFSELKRKDIGNGAPNDGWSGEEVHGWSLGTTGTGGSSETRYVDDFSIYGDSGTETPLTVAFAAQQYEVMERATAAITVELSISATHPVTVNYRTAEGYATPDRDYTPVAGTMVIPAGETAGLLSVDTLSDRKHEGDENLMLVLSDPVSATMGFNYRTMLTILDDDPADPALVHDFEGYHSFLDSSGDVNFSITELMAGDTLAVPGQGTYEKVLSVAYDTTGGDAQFAESFVEPQDWSGYDWLSFWYYGSNSGETVKVELLDNQITTTADVAPAGWSLVWSDEFTGAAGTPPDPNVWKHEIGDGTLNGIPGWGNSESEYYTDSTDNAALDGDGNLAITMHEVNTATTDLACWYGPCEYTSARLISEDRMAYEYGRVEARVKVPDGGDGLWPAFWMLGTNIDEVGWPQSGEIDIMEYVSRIPTEIFGTIHGPGYSGGASFGDTYDFGVPVSQTYHTYAIEWGPDIIDWYVDGIHYHSATPDDVDPNEWVFNHPFYLILNLAIGGNFGGAIDPDIVFPQQMLVDYVRVYQAENSSERFEATFVDDFDGWHTISLPFSDFERSATQPADAPDDGLTLTEVWGYGLQLPDGSSGSFHMDRVYLQTELYTYLPIFYIP